MHVCEIVQIYLLEAAIYPQDVAVIAWARTCTVTRREWRGAWQFDSLDHVLIEMPSYRRLLELELA